MNDRAINRRLVLGAGLSALMGTALRPAYADLSAEVAGQAAAHLVPGLVLSSQLLLGHRLVERLAIRADGNVMVSPASLAAVLAMLTVGASHSMQHAIHHVLGFSGASSRGTAQHISNLKTSIGCILRQTNAESPLALANMVVFDPASKPHSESLAKLTVEGADVSVEDLRKAETIKRVNEWVATRTRDLIPSILNGPLSHPGIIALNALYFKDKWKVPFDRAQTKMEKFHLVGGSSADAAIMYSPDGRYRFRQNDRFIAAELSYASDDFKLVVVTTKTLPARAHEFALVAGWLGGRDFVEQDGLVALPPTTISSDIELLHVLDAMGLAPARSRHDAFRRFSSVPQTLSRVVQKAVLKINEEGTEAAAATAATTLRSTSMDVYTKMIVNKPFVFALREKRTGLVLLNGYVAKAGEKA